MKTLHAYQNKIEQNHTSGFVEFSSCTAGSLHESTHILVWKNLSMDWPPILNQERRTGDDFVKGTVDKLTQYQQHHMLLYLSINNEIHATEDRNLNGHFKDISIDNSSRH